MIHLKATLRKRKWQTLHVGETTKMKYIRCELRFDIVNAKY